MINLDKNSRIHIIGIGGIGMSGIARILHSRGISVQGSDKKRSKTTEALIDIGIRVFHSHDKSNITDVDVVIKSSAINDSNPEVVFANKNGITVLERWQILRYIMESKHNIAVTGAHGKTTTTGLLGHVFDIAGCNPNILVGGIINNFHSNYVHGKSDIFIVEADESDATFVKIPSESAIVTNIDAEHLDFYQSFENIKDHYSQFIESTSVEGTTAINADDKNLSRFTGAYHPKIVTYGIQNSNADLFGHNIRVSENLQIFDIVFSKRFRDKHKLEIEKLEGVELSLLGTHNVLNCLGVIAISLAYEINIESILRACSSFSGMRRRFTKIGEIDRIKIIDDYAHHPLEISKTVGAAKQALVSDLEDNADSTGKIIVILQPHRYSRLHSNFDAFVDSVSKVDHVFVVDVYSAGEDEIADFNSSSLANSMNKKYKNAEYVRSKIALFKKIKRLAKGGDYVLFLGAGDITNTAFDFAQNYRNL